MLRFQEDIFIIGEVMTQRRCCGCQAGKVSIKLPYSQKRKIKATPIQINKFSES